MPLMKPKIKKTKGEEKGVNTIHGWLRYHYGSANRCENKNCSGKSKRFEYSVINELGYAKKRKNFRMLCKSCHAKYDYDCGLYEKARKKAKISARKLGKKWGSINGKILGNKYGHICGKKYGKENGKNMGRANALFTPKEILIIRKKVSSGVTQKSIALKYNINPSIISGIIIGRNYYWVK